MDTENQDLDFQQDSNVQENALPESDIEIVEGEDDSQVEASEADPDNQEEGEVERKPKKKKNDVSKLKVNQLMRDKYQLEQERNIIAEERNRLLKENEGLKQINSFSTQAAVTNYETSTLDRLERAKDLKAQAYESGDIKAQIDADIALTKALNEYERLNKWKEDQRLLEQQQQFEAQNQEYQQNPYEQIHYQQRNTVQNADIAKQWISDNDWFMEESNTFDPDLRRFTEDLTNAMDAYLYRAGMAHGIYSPEYFEYLDNEIDKFKNGQYDHMRNYPKSHVQNQYQQQQRGQYMSSPKSVTSGVSNSGYRTNAVANRQKIRLSPEEMEMARIMTNVPGVTAEDYARQVLHERQKAKQTRQNRR